MQIMASDTRYVRRFGNNVLQIDIQITRRNKIINRPCSAHIASAPRTAERQLQTSTATDLTLTNNMNVYASTRRTGDWNTRKQRQLLNDKKLSQCCGIAWCFTSVEVSVSLTVGRMGWGKRGGGVAASLVSIREVNLRWARLVLGWVTVFDSRRRHLISVCNQPPRSTQPSTLRGTVKWVPAKG